MRRIAFGLVALVGVMLVAPTAAAQTQLEPIGDAAGATGQRAALEVVVADGHFSAYWLDLPRIAARYDGRVVQGEAGTRERDGRVLSYGVAEFRVPNEHFGDLLGELIGIGRFTDGSIASTTSPESTIELTLTESAGLSADGGSILGDAFDTAGRLLLNSLAVIIVVAAALLPIALLAAAGFAIWRWSRPKAPPTVPSEDDVVADTESVAG